MKIEVIYTLEQFIEFVGWFLAGDLSTVGLDTETMGKNWLRIQREMRDATPARHEILMTELAQYEKEALSAKTNHLAVIQLATADDRCLVIVLKDKEVLAAAIDLIKTLQSKGVVWLLHNAKFDFHQLAHHCKLRFDDQKIHDTQLCETLIKGARDYGHVSLKIVSHNYSQIPDEVRKSDTEPAVSDWWTYPLSEQQTKYAATDVLVLRHLYILQKEAMKSVNMLRVRALECRLTPRLIRVEDTGAKFDKEKLFQFLLKAKEKMNDTRDVYASVFGDIAVSKPIQILAKIKEHYGVTPTVSKYDKKQGAFVISESADKYALLEAGIYKEPAIEAYIALKELSRHVTWANSAIESPEGRLFVNFYQLPVRGDDNDADGGARTGRMSTSPQLQNLSNFLKQFVVADDGWTILSSDQAGVELRAMASVADVKALKWSFENGISPHKTMCAKITGLDLELVSKKSKEYRIAKEVNFGFTYGMGGPKFCTRVLRATKGDIRLTDEQGWHFRNQFFEQYPEIKWYHQRQQAFGSRHGYVETRSGRRRYYCEEDRPQLDVDAKKLWDPEMGSYIHPELDYWTCFKAADWKWRNITYNFPIQGLGADITKEATSDIIDGFEALNQKHGTDVARMFAIVHDSNDSIIRTDYLNEALAIHHKSIIGAMQKYIPDVPAEAEHTIGRCWAGPPDDGKGHGAVYSIRNEEYGCWVYPHQLSDEDLQSWIDVEFQREVICTL